MNSRLLFTACLFGALVLFGCTSTTAIQTGSSGTPTPATGGVNYQPVTLPHLPGSGVGTPTPTPTAAPTPTPKPKGSCVVTATSLGQNQFTGKYQYDITATFSLLPPDVQVTEVSCSGVGNADGTVLTIDPTAHTAERICSYSSLNKLYPGFTAGSITCNATVGLG